MSQTVESILSNFRKNIFGIEYYFAKFENLAQGADNEGAETLLQYIKDSFGEIGIDIDSSEKKSLKDVPDPQVDTLLRKLGKLPKISAQNYEILSRGSFLMLNNYFEYLLSDLLSYHYNKFQKSLNEKKFTITLKEINEFDSIEELVNSLITKEIESMMIELSFDELIEHFHTSLGIDTERDIINWDVILECRERRHLIVHNSSIVNKKYLIRTKNPFNLKIGDTVTVGKDYFRTSCKEFFLAGLLVSYNSWGKWDKEEATKAIKGLTSDSFELLKQKEYQLVSRFTTYLKKVEPRNEDQEDSLLRAKFNRLISLKKIGAEADLVKELKKIKVGTSSPVFKLAHCILSEKYNHIIELVKQAKALDEIDIHKYNEWPIYEFVKDVAEINDKIMAELGENKTDQQALRIEY